jgi:hypothetical protein
VSTLGADLGPYARTSWLEGFHGLSLVLIVVEVDHRLDLLLGAHLELGGLDDNRLGHCRLEVLDIHLSVNIVVGENYNVVLGNVDPLDRAEWRNRSLDTADGGGGARLSDDGSHRLCSGSLSGAQRNPLWARCERQRRRPATLNASLDNVLVLTREYGRNFLRGATSMSAINVSHTRHVRNCTLNV